MFFFFCICLGYVFVARYSKIYSKGVEQCLRKFLEFISLLDIKWGYIIMGGYCPGVKSTSNLIFMA